MSATSAYPSRPSERTRWITSLRGPKNPVDLQTAYAALWESEAGVDGLPISTATVFLTNRECPYRCLMCDLWKNTLDERVPSGAIAHQIQRSLAGRRPAKQIKLYNSGSFFDPAAIPPEDYPEIAATVAGFDKVIVESHPHFIGPNTLRFQALLAGNLEVAIGLETVHTEVLERLNKGFGLADFERSAEFLSSNSIDLRVFVLLRPPFLSETEGLHWAKRSVDAAVRAGASICCVIPTRGGNGAMEEMARIGSFAPPSLRSLERAQEYGLGLGAGRVFTDLWNAEKFAACACSAARIERLSEMNRTQKVQAEVDCQLCRGADDA